MQIIELLLHKFKVSDNHLEARYTYIQSGSYLFHEDIYQDYRGRIHSHQGSLDKGHLHIWTSKHTGTVFPIPRGEIGICHTFKQS